MDWAELEPSFSTESVYVSSIRSSVQVGTFVKFEFYGCEKLGRLISIDGCNATVNVFEFVSNNNNIIPKMRSTYFQRTQEVYQTHEQISVQNIFITGIIFVFKVHGVLKGLFQIQGCSHSYICRFRLDNDNTPTAIPNDYVRSFPDDYGEDFLCFWFESTALTIWRDISSTRLKIQRILCRSSLKEGLVSSRGTANHERISTVSYNFIKSFLIGSSEIITKNIKVKEEVLRARLEFIPVQKDCVSETILVQSEAGLMKLQELFSETIAFGVSKKKPKYQKDLCIETMGSQYSLNENDRCTRIDCSNNDTNNTKQGVKLTWFDRGTLCVKVIFQCALNVQNDRILSQFYNSYENDPPQRLTNERTNLEPTSTELHEGFLVNWRGTFYTIVEKCNRESTIVKIKAMNTDTVIELTNSIDIEELFNATKRRRRR